MVEAVAEDAELKASMHGLLGELLDPDGAPRHDHVVAVGPAAGGGQRPAGALRRAARVQPGREDGAGRAGLPARGQRRDARALPRALRAPRQDRRRGARCGRLRGQPAAVPLPLRRRADARARRPLARGRGHLHEARRRPPDGPARRCSTSWASTWRPRSGSRSAWRCPNARARADRGGPPRQEVRRGLLRVLAFERAR